MASGQLVRDDSGFPASWRWFYFTGTTATAVKTSGGALHTLVLNNVSAGNIITLYDANNAQTGTFAIVTLPASPQPLTLKYDVNFVNGLTVSVGTASNITLSYI